jgi:hypothetical protein
MAISGAAASSNMGAESIRILAPTLALLNIRLGYWMPNPSLLPSVIERRGAPPQRSGKTPKKNKNWLRDQVFRLLRAWRWLSMADSAALAHTWFDSSMISSTVAGFWG